MDGTCDQFLAGSALAVDQYGAAGRSNRADGLLQLLQRADCADNVVERVASGGIATQGKVLTAERNFCQRPGNGQLDFIHQARTLANVVGCATGFHRLHRGFVVVHGGHQNHRRLRRDLVRMAQDFDAIDDGHLDVGHDHVEERAVDLALCSIASGHGLDLVAIAAQRNVEQFADGAFVVADENVTHAILLSLLPSRRRPLRKYSIASITVSGDKFSCA